MPDAARRPGLVSVALAMFLRALFTLQRRRARALGLTGEAGDNGDLDAVSVTRRPSGSCTVNVAPRSTSQRAQPGVNVAVIVHVDVVCSDVN